MASAPLSAGQKLEHGLLDIETKGFVEAEALGLAWSEVVKALTTFMHDTELLTELQSAAYLVDQRSLWCKVSDTSVRGIPDLIAFWHDRPPVIYDWKVNFYGTLSHERQLLVYNLALTKGKLHADFEPYALGHAPEATRLTEVQLITHSGGHKRHYTVTTTKLEDTESFISDSMLSMYLAGTHRSYAQSCASDYATTDDPQICSTCPFSKFCKQH